MTMSSYTRDGVANHLFNGSSLAVPSAWHVQLHYGSPGLAGTSSVSTAFPSRVACSGWTAASSGAVSNEAAVLFSSAAGAETITHASIWDAASGGNCLGYDALAASKTVLASDSINFAAGEIDVLFQ